MQQIRKSVAAARSGLPATFSLTESLQAFDVAPGLTLRPARDRQVLRIVETAREGYELTDAVLARGVASGDEIRMKPAWPVQLRGASLFSGLSVLVQASVFGHLAAVAAGLGVVILLSVAVTSGVGCAVHNVVAQGLTTRNEAFSGSVNWTRGRWLGYGARTA